MRIYLKINEVDFILESLKYTVLKFSEYQYYPSEEFRQERIAEANIVRGKLRDALKKYNKTKKEDKK